MDSNVTSRPPPLPASTYFNSLGKSQNVWMPLPLLLAAGLTIQMFLASNPLPGEQWRAIEGLGYER